MTELCRLSPNGATMQRRQLDDALPTITRYTGLILTIALVVCTILGHALEVAPAWPAAAGLLLYKGVHDAAAKNNGGRK